MFLTKVSWYEVSCWRVGKIRSHIYFRETYVDQEERGVCSTFSVLGRGETSPLWTEMNESWIPVLWEKGEKLQLFLSLHSCLAAPNSFPSISSSSLEWHGKPQTSNIKGEKIANYIVNIIIFIVKISIRKKSPIRANQTYAWKSLWQKRTNLKWHVYIKITNQ